MGRSLVVLYDHIAAPGLGRFTKSLGMTPIIDLVLKGFLRP
jgi:hypothetical protein